MMQRRSSDKPRLWSSQSINTSQLLELELAVKFASEKASHPAQKASRMGCIMRAKSSKAGTSYRLQQERYARPCRMTEVVPEALASAYATQSRVLRQHREQPWTGRMNMVRGCRETPAGGSCALVHTRVTSHVVWADVLRSSTCAQACMHLSPNAVTVATTYREIRSLIGPLNSTSMFWESYPMMHIARTCRSQEAPPISQFFVQF
jgi:hypothetical protein